MSRITTSYDPKPIPVRCFDWCATRADYEPGAPIGYGPNEQAAIDELLDAEGGEPRS
jgi:hypothetical protein